MLHGAKGDPIPAPGLGSPWCPRGGFAAGRANDQFRRAMLVLPCACRQLLLPGRDSFPCWHYSCGISQKETTVLNSQPKWCHFYSALRVVQWTWLLAGNHPGWMLWCSVPGVPRLQPLSHHGFSVLLFTQLWQDLKAVGIFEDSALLVKLVEIAQGVHKLYYGERQTHPQHDLGN